MTDHKISEIRNHGIRAQGKNELINHLFGATLTRNRAIRAKCYDCTGYYSDGVMDCLQIDCPLYPYHPYRHHDPGPNP
jgi:hypothetical protein